MPFSQNVPISIYVWKRIARWLTTSYGQQPQVECSNKIVLDECNFQ